LIHKKVVKKKAGKKKTYPRPKWMHYAITKRSDINAKTDKL